MYERFWLFDLVMEETDVKYSHISGTFVFLIFIVWDSVFTYMITHDGTK
jgi:hypothetical protein